MFIECFTNNGGPYLRLVQSIRVIKGELETRPIYVRTPEHIEAHLLICMIALIILRVIQKRILTSGQVAQKEELYWSTGLSGQRIQEALNKWRVDKLPGDLYRFNDTDNPDLTMILKAFGIDIPAKLYRRADLKSIKTAIDVFHVGS